MHHSESPRGLQLHSALAAALESPLRSGLPIRVAQLVPNTVLSFGQRLQTAFDRIGAALGVHVTTHHSQGMQDVESLVELVATESYDVVLVQVQGRQGEVRLLEPVLRAQTTGRLAVFIHRPEELILRLAEERDLTYSGARRVLAEMVRGVPVVVLPGPCLLPEYAEMLPSTRIEAIPLGFDPPATPVVSASRFSPDAVVAIGSSTTWGEMRELGDLLALLQAVRSAGPGLKTLGYAQGNCDRRANLKQYIGDERVQFLSNSQILAASAKGEFCCEDGFRTWLHEGAAGRLILRARSEGGDPVMESIPPEEGDLHQWESRLLDFNVQMYREILDARRDPNKQGSPKVEYSGTLHKGMREVIFVVLQSPAMDDVRDFEGLSMVEVPFANGAPDYADAAKRLVDLVRDPDGRRQMIDRNTLAMASLGMDEVAYAYCLLFRSLRHGV